MEHTKDKPTIAVLLFSAVRAQIAMFLTGLALLFLFCAVAYSLADPDTVVVPLSLTALFAGGLAGGIAAVRFSGDGILSGWLSGVMSALLVWLLSFLPIPMANGASQLELVPATILFLCLPLSSLIGAVIGRKRSKTHNAAKPRNRTRKHT